IEHIVFRIDLLGATSRNSYHLGAHVGEHHPAERAGADSGKFKNLEVCQWAHEFVVVCCADPGSAIIIPSRPMSFQRTKITLWWSCQASAAQWAFKPTCIVTA